METRAQSTITCWLLGDTLDSIPGNKLPSIGQVLRRIYHHSRKDGKTIKESAAITCQEVMSFWEKARIPTKRKDDVILKMTKVHEQYRELQKHSNMMQKKYVEDREKFEERLDDLFDIAHQNAMKMMTIEEDINFLHCQRKKGRQGYMAGVDKKLAELEERREERENAKRKREIRQQQTSEAETRVELASSSSSSAESSPRKRADPDYVSPEPGPSTSRRKGMMEIVTPAVASALDRTGVSDRNAVFLLAAAVDALGLPVEEFSLNRETVRLKRHDNRRKGSKKIKTSFSTEDPITIHWDSKLLPALTGTETVDRLAIYVSGGGSSKLLSIPVIPNGTGEAQATAVYEALEDWGLSDEVEFMTFDTTASNTGKYNGACALLQMKLGRSLINFACRHHIFELVAGAAFDSQFGHSKSPDVAIFKRFRDNWNKIDQSTFETGISDPTVFAGVSNKMEFLVQQMNNTLQQKDAYQKRGDYRELLELGVIFLGGMPPRGIRILQPGAFHRARWMAKLIYCLKIFLYRSQFKLSQTEYSALTNFNIFVVQVYLGAWFRCTNPIAAPRRDLDFLQNLSEYKHWNSEISNATVETFLRHLWYLNEIVVGLAFYDDKIPIDEKKAMTAALHQVGPKIIPPRATLTIENLAEVKLHHFITSNTRMLFDALRVGTKFLDTDPTSWPNNEEYKSGKLKASNLLVVNDVAERGIALIKNFNPILTKQEEQKQFLLQIVEQHRQELPGPSKSALSKHFSK